MKDVCKYVENRPKWVNPWSANVAADVRWLHITLLPSRAIRMEPPYVGCYSLIENFDGTPK
jgi:hypothetical protein